MTAEEFIISKLSALLPEYKTQRGIEQLAINLIITSATEYASQQRTEGIKEGFEAAREVEFSMETTHVALQKNKYPTAEDYLNSKK